MVDYLITVGNVEEELEFALADDQCTGSTTVTFEVVNPFEFDVAVQCVQCYSEDNGKVTLSNITGGSGKYQIQLVGGENITMLRMKICGGRKDDDGDALFEYRYCIRYVNKAGEYWVYVRDDAGFTLANCCRPIKFVIVSQILWNWKVLHWFPMLLATATAQVLSAFRLQVAEALHHFLFTFKLVRTSLYRGSFAMMQFSADSVITGLPVGTYIGWVKDANDCISGCEIDNQSAPIDEHRVVVLDAGAVVVDSVYVEEPVVTVLVVNCGV